MSVSAIVVTYNRLSLLRECLSYLLNQTYKLNYIFVVNNDSTDGTGAYLQRLHNKSIIPIDLKYNIGGAGGFNIGMKKAFRYTKSDYFWIMDDDTIPTPNALLYLLKKAQYLHNNFGFLCSNVRWWKNNAPSNIPNVSKDWTKLINKSLVKVRAATFVSVLFNRKFVLRYGFPIKAMFIWGDDTEYTTRLSRKCDSYFVVQSIVLHKSSSNKSYETIFNAPVDRIKFYNYMYRNLIYIDKRYYSLRHETRDIIGFLSDLIEIPFKAHDHKFMRFQVMARSIVKGLFFNPKIDIPSNEGIK